MDDDIVHTVTALTTFRLPQPAEQFVGYVLVSLTFLSPMEAFLMSIASDPPWNGPARSEFRVGIILSQCLLISMERPTLHLAHNNHGNQLVRFVLNVPLY